ncbi:MAG: hypothetical protein QG574_4237 [Cyanobacteriota bacterium erpe_2018_sw_21hr_WHONDRS-SW48-000092_B_bin.40]|jgi:hypothetical protein|nr:hypothetical protein [Cyanobacteriota bacterium erpe_2018_sw_21hr_WHONDRS-SW48-000092_B_bin.40]
MVNEELEPLKKHCDELSLHIEGGVEYIHFKNLKLPEGCSPQSTNAIFCPSPRDGYESRMGFEQKVVTPFPRNWTEIRILDRNWAAFSWRYPVAGLSLLQILLGHFEGLKSNK